MKYQIEYKGDPRFLTIHLDKRITDMPSEEYRKGEEAEEYCPDLAKGFLVIDGMQGVEFEAYCIHLERGQMFEWDSILLQALLVLDFKFDEVKEGASPLYSSEADKLDYAEVDSEDDSFED